MYLNYESLLNLFVSLTFNHAIFFWVWLLFFGIWNW